MSTSRTRVVPTSALNGYGPGRYLAQYWSRYIQVWLDIGDPHDTEAEALAAAALYEKEKT